MTSPRDPLPLSSPRGLARGLAVLLLVAAAPGLAYVVPSEKVIESWARTRGPAPLGVEVPVRWEGREGLLYASGSGRHALVWDGGAPLVEPGPGVPDSMAPLWRGLDLFALPAQDLVRALEAVGVDLRRSGYARSDRSGDGAAFTVGARGEGEDALAHVRFARVPLWPVGVRLPGLPGLEVGGAGPGGWPRWFDLGPGGRIEVVGPPRPVPARPAWALGGPAPGVEGPALPDWRRAFEGARP